MSCAVAIANSPVFSPSRVSLFCKTNNNSPETLNFNHNHGSTTTSSSSSCCSPSFSSSSSPSSPFRLRIQKSPIGLRSSYNKKEANVVVVNSNSGLNSSDSSNGSILKRKRPIMKIDIPVVASLSFSDIPVSEQSELEVEREGYSVYCKRGRRAAMEDRFSAVDNLHGDGESKQAFFGVFDGHGGAKAAEFAAEHLHKNIMKDFARRVETVEAIKQGYLTTDSDFLKEDVRGGACCVTALISQGDLLVSNAGDCRAVLCRGGVAEALTSDHRPSREDERERIETKGGYVDCRHGVWRLQGSLAVSRGIGDQHLKQWVIAEPETKSIRITSDCEFLVLASDGLWDKVTNQEAIDIARPLCVDLDKPAVLSACKRLAELAVMRGSLDDISVMNLAQKFKGIPTWISCIAAMKFSKKTHETKDVQACDEEVQWYKFVQ
ncbi:phosphatase 2C [Thalictrum thalictroides]|uniref:protein-serine/threonine phosphatase n=1 Tax=Thalictrum thalictroides TaxID=46969 RepID=A0A7J6W5G1_THATH|nr:phosphatase 2C [Thalictrum thalictroides]